MAGVKLDKAKRRAAGHVCLAIFGLLQHSSYQTGKLLTHIHEGLADGLTPKEVEFIEKHKDRMNKEAEVMRLLGWRFLGMSNTPAGRPRKKARR